MSRQRFAKMQTFAVIIRASAPGNTEDRHYAIQELNARGSWLSKNQLRQAGLTKAAYRLICNSGLPVRDDVKTVTFHRNPTDSEIQFGYGAIHYRDFDVKEVCHAGTRVLRKWIKADDGLRYYR